MRDIKNNCSIQEEIVTNLKTFRDKIYHFFTHRKNAALDLLDALSSKCFAQSVMDLSLSPLHRRNYCSITRVVSEFYLGATAPLEKHDELIRLICGYCPALKSRRYHLFGVDATANPRPYSPTQEDRGFVYSPSGVASKKPITIGHQYSVAAYLPEKEKGDPPWLIPLACDRVSTQEKSVWVGLNQIIRCLSQEVFSGKLCASVVDSAYSNPESLVLMDPHKNHVFIARLRSNRVLYLPADPEDQKTGRPKKFGEKFNLKDKETWPEPSGKITLKDSNKHGETIEIQIESWDSTLMRGRKTADVSEMPFRLVKIVYLRPDSQEPLFIKPLWLIVHGEQRHELTLEDIFNAYRQRFDLEHFFRFGKNNLLLDQFQTSKVQHEEAWWQLVLISYVQLYLSRDLAVNTPKPWEKYLPAFQSEKKISPTQVQKCFETLIRGIGTPAKMLKGHRNARGRRKGELQIKRPRHPVVVKGKKARKVVLQI